MVLEINSYISTSYSLLLLSSNLISLDVTLFSSNARLLGYDYGIFLVRAFNYLEN